MRQHFKKAILNVSKIMMTEEEKQRMRERILKDQEALSRAAATKRPS